MRYALVLMVMGWVVGAPACCPVWSQGTTVITHGYQANGAFPVWPLDLGEAIAARSGGGTVLVHEPSTGEWSLVSGSLDVTETIVVVFDWAADSSWVPGDETRQGTAIAAADALYAALLAPQLPGALAGESLVEQPGGGARSLHFIGHSRGAVVNSEAVRRLVVAGLEVAQVSSIDPHPIDGPDPDLLDPSPTTWEGVEWADNYWRADGCNFDEGCFGFDFDGQPVFGAFNNNLGFLDSLGGVDNRLSPCTLEHILMHVWYHGTVDLTATSDGECSIDRGAWYTSDGSDEGYFYSEIGGGVASRPCGPGGGCPDAGRELPGTVDSVVNGDFEFGGGQDAGWLYQGGGGTAAILSEPGNSFLALEPGADFRVHNRLFVPDGVAALGFSTRIVVADPAGDDVLDVTAIADDGTMTSLGTVPLFPAPTAWEPHLVPWPVTLATGSGYRLRFSIEGGMAVGAAADVDDITLISGGGGFVRGDCNGDGDFNVSDPIRLLGTLFGSDPALGCDDACDGDDDGVLAVADAVVLLDGIFGTGGIPSAPFPDCGDDPTADGLDCGLSPSCP